MKYWISYHRLKIQRLWREKQCTVNTVYSEGGVLLTSTWDIVERSKQYFEDLLNPTDTSSSEEAGPGDLGLGSHISGDEVAEVVKKHTRRQGPRDGWDPPRVP